MTMKNIDFLILGAIALGISSCCEDDFMFDNNHHIKGRGTIETKNIITDNFSKVKLENVANVNITTGETYSVEFTAYENILEYMDADVIGDELVLKYRHNIDVSSDEEIKIDITMPEIKKVTLNGVGNFYLSGPIQEQLNIDLNGVGNINAFELPVYQGDIDVNGTGNVKIFATEKLNININGIGNVYYQGDPDLSYDINGFGEVVKD
jgi:hypothetical protein